MRKGTILSLMIILATGSLQLAVQAAAVSPIYASNAMIWTSTYYGTTSTELVAGLQNGYYARLDPGLTDSLGLGPFYSGDDPPAVSFYYQSWIFSFADGTFREGSGQWFANAGHYDALVDVRLRTRHLVDDDGPGPNASSYEHWIKTDVSFDVLPIPEPSSLFALLGGIAGLLGMRRRRA
jgi:hypothetical protein